MLRTWILITLALIPWFFIDQIDAIAHVPQFYPHTLLWDIPYKLAQYWCPYFLIFPAAGLLALIWRWSPILCSVLLGTLLIYPWYGNMWLVFYDQYPHAIIQQWQWSWQFAREGYWAGAQDRRWMLSADGFKLVEQLQHDIEAGAITSRTHILHLADSTSMYTLMPLPVYTGIDEDVIDFTYDPTNLFEQGGRVHGPAYLSERSKYQYIYDQRSNHLTIN